MTATEGLPLFGGVQLVVDTTLVSPLRSDGSLRPNGCGAPGCKATQGAHVSRAGGDPVQAPGWLSGPEKWVGVGLEKR